MKSLLIAYFILATLVLVAHGAPAAAAEGEAKEERKEHKKSLLDDILTTMSISTKSSLGGDGKPQPTFKWKPVLGIFANAPEEAQKRLMGDKADKIVFDETANQVVEKTQLGFSASFGGPTTTTTPPPLAPIPDEFDSRKAWPKCAHIIGNIRTQSGCGSCWAVSTASVFTDRLCISMIKEYNKTGGDLYVSEEDTMSCANPGDGCDGGNAYNAFTYFIKQGAVSGGNESSKLGCKPYPFTPDQQYEELQTPECTAACKGAFSKAYDEDKYYMVDHTRLNGTVPGRIEKMQREIMENGPVHGTLMVYEDFMHYGGGLYSYITGDEQGTHAIRIIGWGQEKDENGLFAKYWLIANSWGEGWGEKGLFRIALGRDECGIETRNINYGNVATPPAPEEE